MYLIILGVLQKYSVVLIGTCVDASPSEPRAVRCSFFIVVVLSYDIIEWVYILIRKNYSSLM